MIPFGVDRLIRQRHEIARPHASLARNEQATSRGLEDGDADDVADAELDFGRRTRSPNVAERVCGPYSSRVWMTSGVSLTKP